MGDPAVKSWRLRDETADIIYPFQVLPGDGRRPVMADEVERDA